MVHAFQVGIVSEAPDVNLCAIRYLGAGRGF